jgi:hypothetical protein
MGLIHISKVAQPLFGTEPSRKVCIGRALL